MKKKKSIFILVLGFSVFKNTNVYSKAVVGIFFAPIQRGTDFT